MKLGLAPAGGNYATLKHVIGHLGLDTSHFLGQGHHRDRESGPRRPLEELLVHPSSIQSYKLKRRLLAEGIFTHRCGECGSAMWRGHPIPLELHHQDGDRTNNVLSNLQLLCPNGHVLTENYRGRNIGNGAPP